MVLTRPTNFITVWICVLQSSAGCTPEKPSPKANQEVRITPMSSKTGTTKISSFYNFSSTHHYQLKRNDSKICTEPGCNSTQSRGLTPTFMTPEEIAEDIAANIVIETKDLNANLLFLMDDSASITKRNFPKEIHFVKALISAFPLSEHRSAGLILFSNRASVQISVKTNDTCAFLKHADAIKYHGGGTNILLALQTANQEISLNGIHKKNLVFLITDGQSADPTSEADILKNNGNILFTIGVANYDRKMLESIASVGKLAGKLFYGVADFAAFEQVSAYLETTSYLDGTKYNCT